MRRALVATLGAVCACACPSPRPPAAPLPVQPVAVSAPAPPARREWPGLLASALAGHGEPHAQPLAFPRDARGTDMWLAFVGSADVSVGAWRVTRLSSGEVTARPVERWPTGVRVVAGVVRGGTAYVLLETVAVLDQPAGLRGVWIDACGGSPYDPSPMALANVRDVAELQARLDSPPAPTSESSALALLATLRSASGSASSLARAIAPTGMDVGTSWQSLFAQVTGHLDVGAVETSGLTDRVLAVTRAALSTQACGADACEAWTDRGHAVLRFAQEGGRSVLRSVVEDEPLPAAARGSRRLVRASESAAETERLLAARSSTVLRVLGQAPLTSSGGTVGVGLTDLAPDTPLVAVEEGTAARVFALPLGSLRASAGDADWQAAFADVDGDGRTDVVVRLGGHRPDGAPVAWSGAFLAPPPSVQAASLEPDLASALAAMDAPDANAAARAIFALPSRTVSRDEACRLLSAASTPAGFARVAGPNAPLLLFQEPGLPTWLPRVVTAAHVAADEVSVLWGHCAELTCSTTRPYCSWSSGANSLHAWFGWRDDDRLQLVGAADYNGE